MGEFLECVNHMLVVFKREAPIERCIEFVGKYVAQTGQSDPKNKFADVVLKHLLSVSDAKDKAVRFRSCQVRNHHHSTNTHV